MKNTKQAAAQLPVQPWWQKYMAYLLPALAFLLYANTIGNGYNMDDELVTRKHKLTSKGISAIPKIFSSPYYSDDMGYSYEYRPMVLTSFAIEHQFFGDKPAVSHFFNVLLYALTVLVLFRLLRKLFHAYPYPLAVVALLLFVFHPMHTEAVASIKNRDELLALLFGLLSWTYALNYMQTRKHWQLLPVLLFFVAGLLSKSGIAPLVVLIPLSALFFLRPAFLPLLLVGISLSGAAFMFTPSTEPWRVLPAYVFVGLLPSLVWVFINGKLRGVWDRFRGSPGDFIQAVRHNPGEDFTLGWVKAEWNFRELVAPLFLLQLALFAGAIVAGLVQQSPAWFTLGFLVFAIGFYMATDTRKNAWLGVFTVLFVLTCLMFNYSDYAEFGPLFLGILFFLDRRFKNPFILVCLLILGIPMLYFGTFPDYLLTLIVLLLVVLGNRFRWARWAIWLPVTIFAVILGGGIYRVVLSPAVALEEFSVQLVNIMLLLTIFPKTRRWVSYLLLFLVFPFFFWISINDVYRAQEVWYPSTTVNAPAPVVVPPDSLSTATLIGIPKAERPISFAEVPVNAGSPMQERLGSAMEVLGFYFQKMILPYPMGYYYGYAYFKPVSITEPIPLLLLALHLGLLVCALLAYRNHRPLSFGLLFYLMAIALFSGFLYPVVGMAGDRFSYVASLGFCLAVGYLLLRFLAVKGTWPTSIKTTPLFSGVLVVLLLVYGFITLIRNTEWKNAITLMGNDIGHLDESAQAHNLYALNLMRESYEGKGYTPQQQFNMRKLAVAHFGRALEIWPSFFNAAYDKGRAGVSIGDFPTAIEGFEAAVAIGPAPGFMDPYYQLTELYIKTGRYPDYLANARRIFAIDHTQHPEAYNLMAKGYFLNGNLDSAKAYLRQGMEVFPADQSLRKNMAEIFKNQGVADSAAYYSRQ